MLADGYSVIALTAVAQLVEALADIADAIPRLVLGPEYRIMRSGMITDDALLDMGEVGNNVALAVVESGRVLCVCRG